MAQKPGNATEYSNKECGKESPLLRGALQDRILDHSPQATICPSQQPSRQLSQGSKALWRDKGLDSGGAGPGFQRATET